MTDFAASADWLTPGTLWPQAQRQSQLALQTGALQSIPTTYCWLEDAGIRFLVRVLDNLARKERAAAKQQRSPNPGNPFLPYEPDLFVTHVSPTHLVLLNKYNVVEQHLLIVTRAFESQDELLTRADFQALALCLVEQNGFAFYNGGKLAGASQPHKHLQLVPLPFIPEVSGLPIEPWVTGAQGNAFPFQHAVAPLSSLNFAQPEAATDGLYETYQSLMHSLNLWPETSNPKMPLQAYNLLLTRDWMLIVPRSQDSYQGISINSLGFAGALLVKSATQLEQLRQIGPMTLLASVAQPLGSGA